MRLQEKLHSILLVFQQKRKTNIFFINKPIKMDTIVLIILLYLAISCVSVLFPINTKAEEIIRSSSLHEQTTLVGNVERIDYINDEGIITLAADKHYATMVRIKSDSRIIEKYYDEKGNPAKQRVGHYALIREINNKNQDYKIIYIDSKGRPTINIYGYAIAIREFNDSGKVIKETYYDVNENPVKLKSLGYSCVREYDDNGRNIVISYLDKNGDRMITDHGYAVVRRVYYESGPSVGRVEYEYYYDTKLKPIKLSHGQFGQLLEYDAFGRSIVITYLDEKGNPIITNEGYTKIRKTYYEDDTIQKELYYDINDKPICLSEGQYGLRYVNGKKTYIDSEGKELFNLRNYLFSNQWRVAFLFLLSIIIALLVRNKMCYVFFALYLFFIIYMTVLYREKGIVKYNIDLLWSYKQFLVDAEMAWEIINNIWLFIPLGVVLFRIYPRKVILLFPVVLSFAIETFQLISGTGLCELDDVLSNSLGGFIGFTIAKLTTGIKPRIKSWRHIHTA